MIKLTTRSYFYAFFIVTSSLAFCFSPSAFGQTPHNKVVLSSGTVILNENVNSFLGSEKFKSAPSSAPIIVQFFTLPDEKQRSILQEKGLNLLSFLGENSYLASFRSFRDFYSFSNLVSGIALLPVEMKKSSRLAQQITAAPNGTLEILLSVKKDALFSFVKNLPFYHAVLVNKDALKANFVIVSIKANAVAQIIADPAVLYATVADKPQALGYESHATCKSASATQTIANGGLGLSGAGIQVAVGDENTGSIHVDLQGKSGQPKPFPLCRPRHPRGRHHCRRRHPGPRCRRICAESGHHGLLLQ